MFTIAEWLASLGLVEYAERFVENRIDLSVLGDLTDQDLKDLGVALGNRRKMLRTIAGVAALLLPRGDPQPWPSQEHKTSPSAASSR